MTNAISPAVPRPQPAEEQTLCHQTALYSSGRCLVLLKGQSWLVSRVADTFELSLCHHPRALSSTLFFLFGRAHMPDDDGE